MDKLAGLRVYCAAAAVYSHFFAILIIAAHTVSLLFLRCSMVPWKRLLVADLLMAILLLPAVVFLLRPSRRRKRRLGSAPQPRSGEVSVLFADAVKVPFGDLRGQHGCWPLGTPCVAALLKVHGRSALQSRWLVIPPAIAIAASLLQPILVERYLAVCIPAAVLLAADGLGLLAERRRVIAPLLLVADLWFTPSPAFAFTCAIPNSAKVGGKPRLICCQGLILAMR